MTELEMSQHLHGASAPHRGGWEGTVTVEGAREVRPVISTDSIANTTPNARVTMR